MCFELDGDKMGITELGDIIIFSLLEDMKREGGFGEAAQHQKKESRFLKKSLGKKRGLFLAESVAA